MATDKNNKEPEASIHGDLLEVVLSHVPLVHLIPARYVSKSWRLAVSSSLRFFNRPKPWLILHTQTTRSPYVTTTLAYDPRSDLWIEIRQPPVKYVSALRSSHSNLLYMLSPSKLSFSVDPLNLTWHHTDSPLVWRTDPIVAAVGRRIIFAGGACDFEDDPLAVEMYDTESRAWDTCESMPAVLRDSAASTWLSIASDDRKMFVTEKVSGVTHSFDPETKTWEGPYDLRPDPRAFVSVIGIAGDRLVLVELIGESDKAQSLKLYEVSRETFECEEFGEMPSSLLATLKNGRSQLSSINLCCAYNFVYLQNPSQPEVILFCEFENYGCRWGSVQNSIVNELNPRDGIVFTCSKVGIVDLQKALSSENCELVVKVR